MESGVPSVVTPGTAVMPLWSVDSWDTLCLVRGVKNIQGILSTSIKFHFTGAIPFTTSYFGRGTGAILIDYVSCTGNEQFLANCTHRGLGVTSSWCTHYWDVGVQCPGNINKLLGF